MNDEGGSITVSVVHEDDNRSAISLSSDVGETRFDHDGMYKSDPDIALLPGNIPVIAWTKVGNNSDDPLERMRSIQIKTVIGQKDLEITGDGSVIENEGLFDMHPSLASDGNGNISMVFTRNLQGNPDSSMVEIFFTELNHNNWTNPVQLTSSNQWDGQPDITYSSGGDLWMVWSSEGGEGRIRSRNGKTGEWGADHLFGEPGEMVIAGTITVTSPGQFPVVSGVIAGDHGKNSLVAKVCDPLQPDLFINEYIIRETEEWISEVSITTGLDDTMILSWREGQEADNRLFVSRGIQSARNVTFTSPLPITSSGIVSLDPEFIWMGDGVIEGGYVVSELAGNSTNNLSRIDEVLDLSNCGSVLDVRYDLLGEYSRFETVSISADIVNIGLSEKGKIYVNMERESYDPITDEWTNLTLTSKLVQFSNMKNEETVQFTTTLVDHQQRYRIWTASGWGYPPPYLSEMFVNLPMVADPVFKDVELVKVQGTDMYDIRVEIENRGPVSIEELEIEVMGSTGMDAVDPPDLLWFDPSIHFDILNTTSLEVGPDVTADASMFLDLEAGRNFLALSLRYPGGYRLYQELIIEDIFPDINMVAPMMDSIILAGDVLESSISLENNGEVSNTPSHLDRNVTIELSLRDQIGNKRRVTTRTVDIPDPESSDEFTLKMNTTGLPSGIYTLCTCITSLEWIPENMKGLLSSSRDIYIVNDQKVTILDHLVKDVGAAGKVITVRIRNDSNRTLSTTRITLFNGRPNDNIIVSEGLVGGMKTGENRTVELTFDLDEGLYYLTLVASSARTDEVSIPWNDITLDQKGFQLEITEVAQGQDSEDEVDMKEVTDALMIGGASIITVLLVSLLFKAKDEDDGSEDDGKK
jgi:hypothetical protein